MIDQFLTPEECESYFNYSEYLGYELADVDFYGVRKQSNQIRTNERADIESQELADKLWNELQNYPLPSSELGNPAGLSPYIRENKDLTFIKMELKNIRTTNRNSQY